MQKGRQGCWGIKSWYPPSSQHKLNRQCGFLGKPARVRAAWRRTGPSLFINPYFWFLPAFFFIPGCTGPHRMKLIYFARARPVKHVLPREKLNLSTFGRASQCDRWRYFERKSKSTSTHMPQESLLKLWHKIQDNESVIGLVCDYLLKWTYIEKRISEFYLCFLKKKNKKHGNTCLET